MHLHSNNVRLRALVTASGVSMPVALTVFNRGLGPQAVSASRWNAFLAEPGAPGYAGLDDALLTHAEAKFASLGTSSRVR